MHRRDFLKLSGISLGALFLKPTPTQWSWVAPAETQAGNVRYRGGPGEILVFHDAGQTWQTHIRLGPDQAVLDLSTDYAGRVYAQIGFQGFNFHIALSDNGKQWMTT